MVAVLFLVLSAMMIGNFWVLGLVPEIPAPQPIAYVAEPCGPDAMPDDLRDRLGQHAHERLVAINSQRTLKSTPVANRWSDATQTPFTLGAGTGRSLPEGMLEALCTQLGLEDGRALGQRILRRAEQSLRDPDDQIDGVPGLREQLRQRVLAGAESQLELMAGILVEAGPIAPRPRVVIRGQARQVATFVIGQEQATEREAATFSAWTDLVTEALKAQGLPVLRYAPRLEHGRYVERTDTLSRSVGVKSEWVEGWFDWGAWMKAAREGKDTEAEPFHELGRLQAIQLLNETGLVEVIFLGHGIEVGAEAWQEGQYQAFRIGPVSRGDEFQEVLNLRHSRRGLTLRYGACLDARAPFWAASCSNRQGGETRPDQSTTAVAFLLENGWYPDAASLEPFVFSSYRSLQAALLEAENPLEAAHAIRAAVKAQTERLAAPGELRAVLPMGPGAWLLRAGGSETPDLLLLPEQGWRPRRDDALRITLATSSWAQLDKLPGSDELSRGSRWDPCAEPADCADNIEAMLPQARRYADGGLPPGDASARYQVGGVLGRRWVEPLPDASHRFLRVSVLRAGGQSLEDYAYELTELGNSLHTAMSGAHARRRLQGFVLANNDGTLLTLPD